MDKIYHIIHYKKVNLFYVKLSRDIMLTQSCICCQQASEIEIIWVMRAAVFGVSAMAMATAITVTSIYELWFLCADFVYIIIFPQLVCVVYVENANTYGSLAGYIIGLFFRLAGGEPWMGLRAIIKYPWYDADNDLQLFPFKSFSMILSLITIIGVSLSLKYAFESGLIHHRYDIFMCIVNIPDDSMVLASRNATIGSSSITMYGNSGNNVGTINPALKFSQDDFGHLADHGNDSIDEKPRVAHKLSVSG